MTSIRVHFEDGHTPGPWRCDTRYGLAHLEITAKDKAVAYAWAFDAPSNSKHAKRDEYAKSEEGHANARLLAASPDLLEACEACIPLISKDFLAGDLLRAAIAKTKG